MSAIKVMDKLLSASCCVLPASQQLLPNQDISKETAVMMQFPGLWPGPLFLCPQMGSWTLPSGLWVEASLQELQ